MMRFPIQITRSERNGKLCSENAYDFFVTIPHIELGLKQAAVVYPPRSIQYDDNKRTITGKLQDDSSPFRMWIDSLLTNDWIVRCRGIMLDRSFKYCTIATTRRDLQSEVAGSKTSILTDIAKGGKN